MKNLFFLLTISFAIYSCGTGKTPIKDNTNVDIVDNDTIRIANDTLEYEIIIVELGFESWLASQPPRGYYGQSVLETKNRLFVTDYNNRVLQGNKYSRDLYPEQIDYNLAVDYGYEVNYLLYNYFVYFQEKYNQKLTGGRN